MINIKLDPKRLTPMVWLPTGITLLLSTGARVPICTLSEEFLLCKYPKAYKMEGNFVKVKNSEEKFPVYIVPDFKISDKWLIHNLPVAVIECNASANMVLPYGCLCRSTSAFYRQGIPAFATDVGITYATGRYTKEDELTKVYVHTEKEHMEIETGKYLLNKDTNGNEELMQRYMQEAYDWAPSPMKRDPSFTKSDIACMYYKFIKANPF